MKRQLYSFALIFTITLITNAASAQNPKTNAGKLNNTTPQGYQPPATPKPPLQKPTQRDSSNLYDTEPAYQSQNVNQPAPTIKKDSTISNNILFGVGLIFGVPQNEFRDANGKNLGVGLGISCLYNLMGTSAKEKSLVNVYIGGTFEYLYFGGESNSFNYDDPYPYNAISNSITASVNINMYSLLLSSRVELFNGPIVPFFEAAVGGRLLDGNENVSIDRTLHNGGVLSPGITFTPTSKSNSTRLESDYVGAYGCGGGFRIGRGALKAEIKVMYMKGSTGRYIDKQSIRFDSNSNFTYSTKTSTTDMLLPQISLTGTF